MYPWLFVSDETWKRIGKVQRRAAFSRQAVRSPVIVMGERHEIPEQSQEGVMSEKLGKAAKKWVTVGMCLNW